MRVFFTLAEAAMNRGPFFKPKEGKPVPSCAGCHGDTSRFGSSTYHVHGGRFSGVAPKPLCGECASQMEYWRDRLCPVVPPSEWGNVEILPKPSQLLRDVAEQDAKETSGGQDAAD